MAKSSPEESKERILKTAMGLFYSQGVHAVGVDTLVEASGVAKMTFYRHFPSKDALVSAFIERSDVNFREWMDEALAGTRAGAERLETLFRAVEELSTQPYCLGCVFQLTAGEFPNPDHPGHAKAAAHKTWFLNFLEEECRIAEVHDPRICAEGLYLLIEGVWSSVRMFGFSDQGGLSHPGARVAAAGKALLHVYLA